MPTPQFGWIFCHCGMTKFGPLKAYEMVWVFQVFCHEELMPLGGPLANDNHQQ